MEVSGPVVTLTPGQVSFLLRLFPVLVAWIYSEVLYYKKKPSSTHGPRNRYTKANLLRIC